MKAPTSGTPNFQTTEYGVKKLYANKTFYNIISHISERKHANMSDRKRVLELFDKYSDVTESRINSGIELYRKGVCEIRVTDKDGKPVKGAKLKITQKNHDFRYGANLFMLDELESDEKNALYKKYIKELCNMATLPFYWNSTEPEQGKTRYAKGSEKLYRRPPIDLCMEFCRENGIEPREHALAYEHMFPDWLKGKTDFEVKAALEKRFSEISERYSDKIRTIEVTNEMVWGDSQTDFYFNPEYVEFCFKLAEKYFPKNQLCINEFTGLAWEDRAESNDKYYLYIKDAINRGARIDAVGMQYHQFNRLENEYNATRTTYNPLQLFKHMDLYATLGKPLQVTEVTIPAYSNDPEDEEIQAQIIEKLYSVWFSHPAMEQIIYWNLVDGYAAFAEQGDMTSGENYFYGGLLRFDMTPKPAYYTIKNLFEKKWHTELTAVTSDNGSAVFNGFYGMYDITAEADGKQLKCEIHHSKTARGKHGITIK